MTLHKPTLAARSSLGVDAEALASALKDEIQGEVMFDRGTRGLYSTTGSNYRQVPIGVVVPRGTDDILATLRACRQFGAPVLSRGGGTSLAGQCCNVAVVMDMSKYLSRIIELDHERKSAIVEPGIVLDRLRDAAEKHGLTFGPDPSTHDHCTLGGMIGNNSCGVHSVYAGKTVENVEALDVVTYRGLELRVGPTTDAEFERIEGDGGERAKIYRALRDLRDRYATLIRERYPQIPRRVSGYNLDELLPENNFNVARALVGTEGTCVTVLRAHLRLVESPAERALVVLGYHDVYTAADSVMEVLDFNPLALEGLDDRLVADMRKMKIHPRDIDLLPDGKGWLMVEFGGDTKEEASERASELMSALDSASDPPNMKLVDDPAQEKLLWKIRESGLGATARVPGENDTWEGWEDSAVPPEKLGAYLRDLRKLYEKFDYEGAFYGHFGQGCLHTRIDFNLKTAEGLRRFRAFIEAAADLVVGYGGSISGEHGDGQSRAEFLPKMFGPDLIGAFRDFKAIWDPDGKMNPGKVVDPYRMDENLRLGVDFNPREPRTHFNYPGDDGSFTRATLRCVGVGACRKDGVGTMCPSYMVTRDERHSTRGRAHLLYEMLKGDPVKGGWRSKDVKEALDLCFSCKGCKSECPVNVDMATYKAEFLSHHYSRRLRPRTAYAMGLIYWWARAASIAPRIVNLLSHRPPFATAAKAAAGVASKRSVPAFATHTFRSRAARLLEAKPSHQNRVFLWVDTFTNNFSPEICEAAVEVLEAAGCSVEISERQLCCGRPLYDYGMLQMAKRQLRQILKALHGPITEGIPVVGLEPSCVAVFRDEMGNLLPHDEDAKRLGKQLFTLAEFLERRGYEPPVLHRKAIVHGHCHHTSVMKMDPDEKLLTKLGLDFEILDSGCCGMAGSFGFEADHYEVSVAAGERVLLPAVRSTTDDTLVIADGFSCREQIAQLTDRRALHLAQVLQLAISESARTVGSASPTKEGDE